MALRLVPVSLAQANEHVAAWHRHNRPVVGHKFSVGVCDNDALEAARQLQVRVCAPPTMGELWEKIA